MNEMRVEYAQASKAKLMDGPMNKVNKEKTLGLIKKIATILLLCCFFLPLSRCTQKIDPQGKALTSTTYLHGYDLATQGWEKLKTGSPGGIGTLLAVINVFFFPIACLALKGRLQAVLHIVCALASCFFLYFWVFLSSGPEYGGLIAIACWLLLFGGGVATLAGSWRR